MELSAHRQHQFATACVAALLGLAAVAMTPTAARATRLPADPMTYVVTPILQNRLVVDAHAANIQSELQDLWTDLAGQA